MKKIQKIATSTLVAAIAATGALFASPQAHALSDEEAIEVQRATPIDRSGKKRVGKASYYHRMFAGRKMADGTPFNPQANHAASKTLPLGTRAIVTNRENGKSAVVVIRDRGPYVDGRIIDLSPRTADELDMREQGIASVEVKPIAVPMPDGGMRAGEGAGDGEADSDTLSAAR